MSGFLHDRDRLCPTLPGVGWIQGNRLRLRLPTGDLDIRAPRRLLVKVVQSCDGSRSLSDLVSQLPERARSEFSHFLDFLLAQGALVDAIHLTNRAAGWGWQSSIAGVEAPAAVTDRLATSASAAHHDGSTLEAVNPPLETLLARRTSARTFSGSPISVEQLAGLLWSAGGMVSSTHPRGAQDRAHWAVPSAGAMSLVRWTLVLQQAVGPHGPGVYRVHFPRPRAVRLQPIGADASLLLRAVTKPWHMLFATGLLVASADAELAALRYRNRALSYLHLEAGGAFQNGGLAAAALGLGWCVVGGYCEDVLEGMCGTQADAILGCAAFGGEASLEQTALLTRCPTIDFVWSDASDGPYPLAFHIARARPSASSDSETSTWGKDRDPRRAYTKAHAEAVERQGLREPRPVVVSSWRDLDHAIDPRTICKFSRSQQAAPAFPFAPFEAGCLLPWIAGRDALTGARVHLPADFIWGRQRMAPVLPNVDSTLSGPPLHANSSGCAAGVSEEDALERALLEVIERDAFMRHWLGQRPGRAIADHHLPAASAVRVAQLRRAGCVPTVQVLDSIAGTVIFVGATNAQRHFTCVAASARMDAQQALEGALDELETMVYTRLSGESFDPVPVRAVLEPRDHALLYAQRRHFDKADRILQPVNSPGGLPKARTPSGLHGLLELLDRAALRCYVMDITPDAHCIDQGRTALRVVKAIVPSLVPITFGHGREPRGMVARVHPGSHFPHPFP